MPIPLTDRFTKDQLDLTKWSGLYGSTLPHTWQNKLRIQVPGDSTYAGMTTATTYTLTGSEVFVECVDAGNQTFTTWEAYPLEAYKDAANRLIWLIFDNDIIAIKRVGGVNTTVFTTPYIPATHRWFKIREASGTVYFETSADGLTWTTRHSEATPFTLTGMTFPFTAGTYGAEATGTAMVLDNFNVVPGSPSFGVTANLSTGFSITIGGGGANNYFLTLTEAVSVSDALARSISKARNETASLIDTVVRQITRSLGESTTLTDTVVASRAFLRSLSETVTHSDTLVRQTVKNVAETITHTDLVAKAMTKLRIETTTLTDTVTAVRTFLRTLVETVTNTDSITKQANKITAETVTNTDTVRRDIAKLRTETTTLTDTLQAAKVFLRSLSETLTASDSLQKLIGTVRSETSTLTDTVARFIGKAIAESASLVDSLTASLLNSGAGRILVKVGADFVAKPVKVFLSGSFVTKPVKFFKSGTWQDTPY